jgi:hypothetical protein
VARHPSLSWTALSAWWLMCGVVTRAPAQQAADTASPRNDPLFASSERLVLNFTADFGAIARDRGTEKHDYPGVLSIVAPSGDSVSLHVKVHTRGHYRLKICQYPPLKIDFDRDEAARTVFAHQKSLKLVGECRGGHTYENYLLEEQLIYRAYNQLTVMSFRVRLAQITYLDAKQKRSPDTRYAFFLEDDDRMAKRNRKAVFAHPVNQAETDSTQMSVFALFQYMIGNTDWAVSALHNVVLIWDSGGVMYPVPYDFDWSGVISPPYAMPDSSLHLQTVRQRTFRNSECYTPEILARVFARFNAQKDTIYALYRAQEGLEPKRVKQALDYYDDFYRTINDARASRRAFIDGCANR